MVFFWLVFIVICAWVFVLPLLKVLNMLDEHHVAPQWWTTFVGLSSKVKHSICRKSNR